MMHSYTYPKANGDNPREFPCPVSADTGSNSKSNSTGDWFCTISAQSSKGLFPKGAVANCSALPASLGYYWPSK